MQASSRAAAGRGRLVNLRDTLDSHSPALDAY